LDEFCRHCLKNVTPEARYSRAPSVLQTPRVDHICPQCGTVLYRTGGQFSLLVKTAALLAVIQLGATGLNALGLPIPKYNPTDWVFVVITAATAAAIAFTTTWLSRKKHPRRTVKPAKPTQK
jgi:hypothetical protein